MAFNITDLFMGMAQGNSMAWLAFGGLAGCAALGVFLLILWMKMPAASKTMFLNNISQTSDPMVITCMPHKLLKFNYPKMYSSGILHSKLGWHLSVKRWLHASETMSQKDIDALTSNSQNYGIEGAPGRGVFVNYSVQTQVIAPELLAFLQHGKVLEKLNSKQITPKIEVDAFISALQKYKETTKEKMIELAPFHIDLPLNIELLKEMLNRSFDKQEAEVLEDQIASICKNKQSGANLMMIVLLLTGISLLVGIVSLVKLFGLF